MSLFHPLKNLLTGISQPHIHHKSDDSLLHYEYLFGYASTAPKYYFITNDRMNMGEVD
jgi:hypothetical protein